MVEEHTNRKEIADLYEEKINQFQKAYEEKINQFQKVLEKLQKSNLPQNSDAEQVVAGLMRTLLKNIVKHLRELKESEMSPKDFIAFQNSCNHHIEQYESEYASLKPSSLYENFLNNLVSVINTLMFIIAFIILIIVPEVILATRIPKIPEDYLKPKIEKKIDELIKALDIFLELVAKKISNSRIPVAQKLDADDAWKYEKAKAYRFSMAYIFKEDNKEDNFSRITEAFESLKQSKVLSSNWTEQLHEVIQDYKEHHDLEKLQKEVTIILEVITPSDPNTKSEELEKFKGTIDSLSDEPPLNNQCGP